MAAVAAFHFCAAARGCWSCRRFAHFAGFAELRLGARELPAPEPGLDRRQRGQVLHRALELFWRDTKDSATLQRRTQAESLQLASECSARAIAELGASRPLGLQAWLLARERERTYQLLARLIEWERARAPFKTEVLEGKQAAHAGRRHATAAGWIRSRSTRGWSAYLVIDYKSGQPLAFEADAQRPCPAAATGLRHGARGRGRCGAGAVHLGREWAHRQGHRGSEPIGFAIYRRPRGAAPSGRCYRCDGVSGWRGWCGSFSTDTR